MSLPDEFPTRSGDGELCVTETRVDLHTSRETAPYVEFLAFAVVCGPDGVAAARDGVETVPVDNGYLVKADAVVIDLDFESEAA